jgi:hypothetical protein
MKILILLIVLLSCGYDLDPRDAGGQQQPSPVGYNLYGPVVGVDQWGITCGPPDHININVLFSPDGPKITTRPDMDCIETATETIWSVQCHTLTCFNLFGGCLWYDEEMIISVNTLSLEGTFNWLRTVTAYFRCNQQFVVTATELF